MIKAMGYNKVFVILLLLAFIAAAFSYNWKILQPGLEKEQRSLSGIKSETSQMSNDLDKLRSGLEKFEKQKSDFAEVRELGFFDSQNRLEAKRRIVATQKESRLLSAKYIIKPAESVSNDKLKDVGYKILNTEISFALEALEDADIYKFIYILNYGFPGQVLLKDFSMEREREITQPLLRKIGVGQAESLVKADLSLLWQTMVPDETISISEGLSQDGGGMQ